MYSIMGGWGSDQCGIHDAANSVDLLLCTQYCTVFCSPSGSNGSYCTRFILEHQATMRWFVSPTVTRADLRTTMQPQPCFAAEHEQEKKAAVVDAISTGSTSRVRADGNANARQGREHTLASPAQLLG